MTLLKYTLCLAVLAVSLKNVRGHVSQETELALLEYMHDSLNECATEFSLNLDELKTQHRSKGTLDGIDKCFLGCVLKKKGVINEEGKYEPDKVLESIKGLIANEDDFKVVETASKACVSVNDEEVSDGNKGCDRAFLLLTCIKKNKDGKK